MLWLYFLKQLISIFLLHVVKQDAELVTPRESHTISKSGLRPHNYEC